MLAAQLLRETKNAFHAQRKRFSAYKRSWSNRGKVEQRRNSKGRGIAAASQNSAVQALTVMLNNHNSIRKRKDEKEYMRTIVVASSTDDFLFSLVN